MVLQHGIELLAPATFTFDDLLHQQQNIHRCIVGRSQSYLWTSVSINAVVFRPELSTLGPCIIRNRVL